jgi:dolichol-phosphate mannosyltransferase
MSSARPRTFVVIPTYNERTNLPVLVRRILDTTECAVLIVDDESPDGTGAVADELSVDHPTRVMVLHRQPPRGLGRAYIDGLRSALERGADIVCQMDADLSHPPEYLPQLLRSLDHADVAVGSRYATGVSVSNWPLRRLLLSIGANFYVRCITGLPVRDVTSGFKCWRREALDAVLRSGVRSDGYALQFEMLFQARRANFRIVEVPIIFIERLEGASKMSGRVIWESILRPLQLVWRAGGESRSRPASEQRGLDEGVGQISR